MLPSNGCECNSPQNYARRVSRQKYAIKPRKTAHRDDERGIYGVTSSESTTTFMLVAPLKSVSFVTKVVQPACSAVAR